ncbi:hypothetical protein ACNS7O_10170 [Haloferacaceae archaeon DSL9]
MDRSEFEHEAWRGLLGVGVGYGLILLGILIAVFLVPYAIFALL